MKFISSFVFALVLCLGFMLGPLAHQGLAQEIPTIHQNIHKGAETFFIEVEEGKYAYEDLSPPQYSLAQFLGKPQGTDTGIALDFGAHPSQGP